ncbi:MAG: hypothetical protein WCC17_02450 [Candidatus Nitrosopolaris sp.]
MALSRKIGRITMVTQTTVGRRSEYHGESVIHSRQSGRVVHLPVKTAVFPHKDYNNIPPPAVAEHTVRPPAIVYKLIRIAMPRSLLNSLKILAKSKRIGVTELLLDIFREHVYTYRYRLGRQRQQPPQPFNNQYYPVGILPSEDTDKTKFSFTGELHGSNKYWLP